MPIKTPEFASSCEGRSCQCRAFRAVSTAPRACQAFFSSFNKTFQQLGQDPESENFSAAQSDFAALSVSLRVELLSK
jgi:hypothetical protein